MRRASIERGRDRADLALQANRSVRSTERDHWLDLVFQERGLDLDLRGHFAGMKAETCRAQLKGLSHVTPTAIDKDELFEAIRQSRPFKLSLSLPCAACGSEVPFFFDGSKALYAGASVCTAARSPNLSSV